MEISFFQPSYLWAAALVAVPILIHLLFRKRTRTIKFSSLRFLRNTAVTASKNKRLKQIILLATRITAILALVAAFAQPFIKKDPFRTIGNAQSTIYCWVDPTVSMKYDIDGKALWQHSDQLLRTLDTLSSPSSEIFVFDSDINEFVDLETNPDLSPRYRQHNFGAMLDRYRQKSREHKGPQILLVFSDFQARHTAVVDSLLSADSLKHPVLMVSVAPKKNQRNNAGIAYPRVTDQLQCSVYTQGTQLSGAELQALSQGMRVGLQQVTLSQDSGKTETVSIQTKRPNAGGILRLQVDDAFAEDNQLYFSSSSNRQRKALVIGDIAKTLPLRTALQLLLDSEVPVRSPQTVRFEDLDSAEIIVLAGVRNGFRPLEALLTRGTLNEKLILVSPVLEPDPGPWIENVYTNHLSGKTPSVRRSVNLHPVLTDTVSSLWRSFPRFEDRTVNINTCLDNLPGTPLVLMNNRKPLISWSRDNNGHVWLLWATPLNITADNNLAETGFFLPMLDRMLIFGLNRLSAQNQQWFAGRSRYNPYASLSMGANVYSSDGRLVARWENQPRISFAVPGIYSIHPDGKPTQVVAVNTDPAEFDLRYRLPKKPAHSKLLVKSIDAKHFRSFVASKSASFPSLLFWYIFAGAILLETLVWPRKRDSMPKDANQS